MKIKKDQQSAGAGGGREADEDFDFLVLVIVVVVGIIPSDGLYSDVHTIERRRAESVEVAGNR